MELSLKTCASVWRAPCLCTGLRHRELLRRTLPAEVRLHPPPPQPVSRPSSDQSCSCRSGDLLAIVVSLPLLRSCTVLLAVADHGVVLESVFYEVLDIAHRVYRHGAVPLGLRLRVARSMVTDWPCSDVVIKHVVSMPSSYWRCCCIASPPPSWCEAHRCPYRRFGN